MGPGRRRTETLSAIDNCVYMQLFTSRIAIETAQKLEILRGDSSIRWQRLPLRRDGTGYEDGSDHTQLDANCSSKRNVVSI